MSTKIHATVDALGNPVVFHMTPGQVHDLKGADALLPDTPAATVIADKAYDAQERVIDLLQKAGKGVVISPKRCRKHRVNMTSACTEPVTLMEQSYNRLKQYRSIATRYDKTARNFLGAIHLAAAVIWLN